jgi:thiamine kinase-like enzyme
MAQLVRRIHALPIPVPARVMSPAMWIDRYSAAAGTLRDTAALRLAALEALPRVDAVLCHSDLHTLNLIDCGQSLLLLDWEYAHATDPLWDLAGWSANNDFSDEQVLDLITSYACRPPTHEEFLRLRILGWLYDFVCLLWCRLWPNAPEEGGVAARARQIEARLVETSGRGNLG